jgi:exodeoxyribonuclease VII small subunit
VKEEQLTYEQAYEELQQIIADIESGEISVDLLSEKVKRATALIQLCKSKLTSTENDVQKILDDLKSAN